MGRIIGIYEKYPPGGGFLDTTLLCVDGKNIFFSYDNRDGLFSIDVLKGIHDKMSRSYEN